VEQFPSSSICRRRVDFWDEDNLSLSLFAYKPSGSGKPDEAAELIRGFKAGDPEFFKTAMIQVYEAVGKFCEGWKREHNCRYVVPVPSHAAQKVSESSKDMCYFISKMFELEYLEGFLFREVSVIPAHLAYPGQRPTSMEHFESLGCNKQDLKGVGVLLFDDVLTTGDTSQACKRRLQLDACGKVVRLFLGNRRLT
jgi:predicted amidophosphoribosyltransferase